MVCIFAPTIEVLVVFRGLQGCAVTGYSVASTAVMAAIFAPEERGRAAGLYLNSFLAGPLLGPLVGGALADQLGWRSCFVALAVLAGFALICLLVVLRQETSHYFALERLRGERGDVAAASLKEAPRFTAPVFQWPWRPVGYLLERQSVPYILVCLLLFSALFSSVIVLPIVLARPPYSLSPSAIGVAYLANGLGSLIASPLGGRLSDLSAARFSQVPVGRLTYPLAVPVVNAPASLIIFGWVMHFGEHLAGLLVGHFLLGVAQSSYVPAVFSYLSVIKQEQAAAAGAALQGAAFISGGAFMLAAVPLIDVMGVGPFLSLLAGLILVASCFAWGCMVVALRGHCGRQAGTKELNLHVEVAAVAADTAPQGGRDYQTTHIADVV